MTLQHSWPGALGDVLEFPTPEISIQNRPIPEVDVDPQPFDLREHVPVHQQQILPSVVIEIEKPAAPADIARILRDPRRDGRVIEFAAASASIERLPLVGKIAPKNIEPPVAIVIRRRDA